MKRLLQFAAGDARKALNLLDLIASTFEPEVENIITNASCSQGGSAEYCPL